MLRYDVYVKEIESGILNLHTQPRQVMSYLIDSLKADHMKLLKVGGYINEPSREKTNIMDSA